MSAADQLPDDILQLIMEDRKADAVMALRRHANLGLQAAYDLVWAAEEDLDFMEDAQCPTCDGKGTIRVRKAEYDPRGRHTEYRRKP